MKNLSQSRPARLAAAICVAGLLLTPAQASASKHEPQWLRALELRSDALDRKYHLGRYAHIAPPPPSDRGFDWTAAAVGSGTTVASLASLGALVIVLRGRGRVFRAS